MKFRITVLFLLLHLSLSAQDTLIWEGVVVDGISNAPMPYTGIFAASDHHGTISRADGSFRLHDILAEDTIVFRASGYKEMRIPVPDRSDTVRLFTGLQLLESVIVLSDVSILYKMIADSKKVQRNQVDTAKTYFELESFEGDAQLELFQAYYNGIFKDYDLKEMELKSARFGLRKNRERYFISLESSRAMREHSLFESNPWFPHSPFELSKKELRKSYRLELAGKSPNQLSGTTYVIRFEPKHAEDTTEFFSGMVWMDSASCNIEKVELSISQTSRHPFQAFFLRKELNHVGLHLEKTFDYNGDRMRIRSIDFTYSIKTNQPLFVNLDEDERIQYMDTTQRSEHFLIVPDYFITTHAFLYAYDYDSHFSVARFEFPKEPINDYRKLYALGKNETFWNCYQDFKIPNDEKNVRFLADSLVVQDLAAIALNFHHRKMLLGGIYIPWSENRVIVRNASFNPTERPAIPATAYQLKGQILMDVNEVCGVPTVETRCVLDPYETYFNLPISPTQLAFINIYFDLLEMERRELEQKLATAGEHIEQWDALYKEQLQIAEKHLQSYLREVDRGTNTDALLKWNNEVEEALSIDNVALFKVFPDQE